MLTTTSQPLHIGVPSREIGGGPEQFSATQQRKSAINPHRNQSKRSDYLLKLKQHVPKLVQIQLAQFVIDLVEYSSELTYFAINAFQTSSLRRVQVNTLERFNNFCVPRVCTFYHNLDTEFDSFVQKMRDLCFRAKRTFLDIRVARIHFPDGNMMSLPETRRSIDIFKCNINRLRDLRQIHQDIGHDLLLPNDQLYVVLDLLVTDFELLNCELEAEVKFYDAMILQTMIKDIFLQYRIALTWIYPAVKFAAYRPGEPNPQQEIKKCNQPLATKRVDQCSKKRMKKIKHSTNTQELPAALNSAMSNPNNTSFSPTWNINQNFEIDTASEGSSEHRNKKRTTILTTSTAVAIHDLNRYLTTKELHETGQINLKKSKSNTNINTASKVNQIIEKLIRDHHGIPNQFIRRRTRSPQHIL